MATNSTKIDYVVVYFCLVFKTLLSQSVSFDRVACYYDANLLNEMSATYHALEVFTW